MDCSRLELFKNKQIFLIQVTLCQLTSLNVSFHFCISQFQYLKMYSKIQNIAEQILVLYQPFLKELKHDGSSSHFSKCSSGLKALP